MLLKNLTSLCSSIALRLSQRTMRNRVCGLSPLVFFLAVSAVLHTTVFAFDADSDIIIKEPLDLAVVKGEKAVFQCRVENLDIDHSVQWSIDGTMYGPWKYNYRQGSFSYPKDGDTSIGVYDIVVDAVSWREHGGSTFECQIQQTRKRSRAATLTVIVPPTRADIFPEPTNGLIVIDVSNSLTNISCESAYASPGSAIRWWIDGEPADGNNHYAVIENAKGAKLEKVVSTLSLSKKHNSSHAHSLIGDGLSERKISFEETYDRAYYVTCRIFNSIAATNVTESVWILFESESFSAGRIASTVIWIVVGVICALTATATSLILVCVARRRRHTPAHVQRRTGLMTFETDRGLRSSAASDGQSDISTLDSVNGIKNEHMLHGQMEGTCRVGQFACGDNANITVRSSVVGSNRVSSASSPKSAHSSYMSNDLVRFLNSRPPHYRRGPEIDNSTSMDKDSVAYSLPRFGGTRYQKKEAMEEFSVRGTTLKLSTFASLPRRSSEHSRSMNLGPGTFSQMPLELEDSLPPPPPPPPESLSQDLSNEDIDLPPPMPDIEQCCNGIKYNAVSQLNDYLPTADIDLVDRDGVSEASPEVGPTYRKFASPNLPGSLV